MSDINVSLQDIVGSPPPSRVKVVSQIAGAGAMPCDKKSSKSRGSDKRKKRRMSQAEFVAMASQMMSLAGPDGERFRRASTAVSWRLRAGGDAAQRWMKMPHEQRMSILVDTARSLPLPRPVRMAANPWELYRGPRGGKGWKHSGTGDVRYGGGRPSARETGGDAKEEPTSRLHPVVEKHAEGKRAEMTTQQFTTGLNDILDEPEKYGVTDEDADRLEICVVAVSKHIEAKRTPKDLKEWWSGLKPNQKLDVIDDLWGGGHSTKAEFVQALHDEFAELTRVDEVEPEAEPAVASDDESRKFPPGVKSQLIGYRSVASSTVGTYGTFYSLKPQPRTTSKKSTNFDNLLQVPQQDVEPFEGLPAEALAAIWFPDVDMERAAVDAGLESGELMDKMVADEAVRRGYDGIQYGDYEFVDLKDYGKAEEDLGTEPSMSTRDEGPQEGDRSPDGLIFRKGRWHRDEEPGAQAEQPARVEVRGDIYEKTETGWRNVENPVYNASDEMMQRWRDRGIVTDAKETSDGGKDVGLEAVGGSGSRRGVSAGEPVGSELPETPPREQPGTGQRTGRGRGLGSDGTGPDVAGDETTGDAGSRGDTARDRARTSIAGSLHGTELEQPDTADVQAAVSKPPTPETPTDLSAGNFRYHTRDFASGGLKTKFRNNIAALRVLQAMRAEGRDQATPEEQLVLSKFVGWGQFPAVFNDYNEHVAYDEARKLDEIQAKIDPDFKKGDWKAEQAELRSLLTREEWTSARKSTLNAHFTHPEIVDAHWKMAQKLGYTGGRFLETSAGVGYYLGQMPAELAARSRTAAVEIETSTGAMLKALYPSTRVEVQGFEKYAAPDNFYDLVASNVPFGDWGLHDPRYNKYNANIHDYFFLKSADLAKPGGLIMHITSTGTMDKPDNDGIRKRLAEQCEIVGAIRMPGDTHKENAGTSVVTDMLILRKKIPGLDPVSETETPPEAEPKKPGFTGQTIDSLGRLYHWKDGVRVPGPKWDDVVQVDDPDGGKPITVNRYFAEHPEAVLGRLDRSGTMYSGEEKNVSLATPEELSEALGREVHVEIDPETNKRQFLFEDGSKVPPAAIREAGKKLFDARLQAAIDRLPEGVFRPEQNSTAAFEPEQLPAPGDVKDGAFTIQDGKLFRRDGGGLIEVELKRGAANALARIGGMLAIRDAARALHAKETDNLDATHERDELNRLYDEFTAEYGFINDPKNERLMRADPDVHLLRALEKWDAKEKTATKEDTFSKRTVGHVDEVTSADSVSDGLSASLHRFGGVNVEHIAELMGADVADVEFQLIDQKIAYNDPQEGWKPADQYLSGNVRRKLIQAQAAAAVDPKYQANVEALLEVQPEDVDYSQITPKIGVPWVPPQDIQQFAKELLDTQHGNPIEVGYVSETGQWLVHWSKDGKKTYGRGLEATQTWGTDRADIVDCLQAALHDRSITIRGGTDRYTDEQGVEHTFVAEDDEGKKLVNRSATADANAKVQEIKDHFKEWIWADDERTKRLERYYNDNFNNIRDIEYNGQHQTLPGLNPNFKPHPHIKDFVWQVVTTGGGLAAHEVGTGKTAAMIISAMELRRLGLAKKPCITCLKSNIQQITEDCLKLYPNAKILSTAGEFSAADRQKIIARAATGDYDIILMTHEHLGLLKMDPSVEAGFVSEEISELDAAIRIAVQREVQETGKASKGNRIVKSLESKKAKLESKLKGLLKTESKDLAMTFEQTGIDQVFLDESHAMKSLPVITSGDRIKGVPTQPSQRATNMLMKARWLQEQNGGRGVVFATGTPIDNSMAEMFTLQRYLQFNELKERGVHHFDAWKATFGEVTHKAEFSVTGQYKPATRLSEFNNIPELMHMARSMMDIVRADDLKRPDGSQVIQRPTRKDDAVVSEENDSIRGLMASLVSRAKAIAQRSGPAEKGMDNMLVICTDGRKGAVDMRLLDDSAPDDPNSKTNQCVRKVLDLFRAEPDQTQLIFSDVGVHPQKQSSRTAIQRDEPIEDGGQDDDDESGRSVSGEDFDNADLGSKGRFRLYQDIIDKLVAGGIPREQIADFSQLEGKKRIAAMEAMRRGEVKVAIGGTKRLGTGVNVQSKVMAMHHLDVPWTPAAIEQRDGRGWRHGNERYAAGKPVNVHRYVQEGSLDQFFWQLNSTKANFQNQILNNRQSNIRTAKNDDTEVLTPEQLMAVASGDTRELDRVNLEEEVKTLRAAQSRHKREQSRSQQRIDNLQAHIPKLEEQSAVYDQDVKYLDSQPDFEYTEPDTPEVEAGWARDESGYRIWDDERDEWKKTTAAPAVPGVKHAKAKEANEALQKRLEDVHGRWLQSEPYEKRTFEPVHLGDFRGLRVTYDPNNKKGLSGSPVIVEGKSGEVYSTGASPGGKSPVQSIDYVLRHLKKRRDDLQPFIEGGKRQLEAAKESRDKDFSKSSELEEKEKKLDDLLVDMGIRQREVGGGRSMSLSRRPITMSLIHVEPIAGYDDDLVSVFDRMLQLPGVDGARLRMAAESIEWRLRAGGRAAKRWDRLPLVRRLSLLVDTARVMPIRMAGGTNPWTAYKGPRGGTGWVHGGTRDVRYQADQPEAHETGGSEKSETPKPSASRPDSSTATPRVTETPEFKKWFGDSKVVDKDGEPMRVFHGSGREIVGTFGERTTFFTTDSTQAGRYANRDKQSRIYPTYLKIENPAQVTFEQFLHAAEGMIQRLRDEGHDGMMVYVPKSPILKDNDATWYVAFSPDQIKSATGNRGAFDPSNPDIRMASSTNPWTVYRGPRGGKGWKHSGTGDIRYGGNQPGASETGSGGDEAPSAVFSATGEHLEGKQHPEMTQKQFSAGLNDLLDNPEKYGMSDEDADRLEMSVVAVSDHMESRKGKEQAAWWKGLQPHEKLGVIDELFQAGHGTAAKVKAALVQRHGEATKVVAEPEGKTAAEPKTAEKPATKDDFAAAEYDRLKAKYPTFPEQALRNQAAANAAKQPKPAATGSPEFSVGDKVMVGDKEYSFRGTTEHEGRTWAVVASGDSGQRSVPIEEVKASPYSTPPLPSFTKKKPEPAPAAEPKPVAAERSQPNPKAEKRPYQQPATAKADGKITTYSKVAATIDANTDGKLDLANLNKHLSDESPHFIKKMVPLAGLRGPGDDDVDASRASTDKGAIVVGGDGFVYDGRHRAAQAIARGESEIEAWVPITAPDKTAQSKAEPAVKAESPKPETDLFGEPIKPAAPTPKAEPIEPTAKGRPQNLFATKGLPGQKNLFADAGVPDDMVQKQAEPKGDTPWTGGEIAKGRVYNIPTSDLHVDPERFQFKIHVDKSGVTDELKSVRKWNPDFAGVLAVWRDPSDNKTYVVNGHHRAELANRLEVPDLPIRYIEAATAKEARGKGALINMAEGRGTAVDAAKFMRDANATPDDLAKEGVSLTGKVAGDATVLVGLSNRAFTNVVRGMLTPEKAVAVAKHLKSHEMQDQLFRLLEKREDAGKDLSMKIIEEMAREMAATPTTKSTERTLFGDIENETSLFVPRNELKAHIRADLSREVRDFMAVASKRRAAVVEEGGNVLNVDENKRIADDASRVLGVYDKLVNRRGQIADAINEGAAGYAKAKTKGERDAVRKQTIESVRTAVFAESGLSPGTEGTVAMGQRRGADAARRTAGVTRSQAANARRRNPEQDGLIRSLAAIDPDFVAGYD